MAVGGADDHQPALTSISERMGCVQTAPQRRELFKCRVNFDTGITAPQHADGAVQADADGAGQPCVLHHAQRLPIQERVREQVLS